MGLEVQVNDLSTCIHALSNEYKEENKIVQQCVVCKAKRVYNPYNMEVKLVSDKRLWSIWK